MIHRLILAILLIGSLCFSAEAQVSTKRLDKVEVSTSSAKFLGKSKAIRELVQKQATSKEKKNASRRLKKKPDNFANRRIGGKSIHPHLEHQGPDPIRQKEFALRGVLNTIEPTVNVQALGNFGSPHDPSGDVSDEYYVQAINVTTVGVYDLDGNLVQSFAMNTLWAEFNASSEGDPIVLYDEVAQKWFVTEFTDPANLLIAVSETKDPLGSYFAYSFATPQFPDYPKYAISPDALIVTTNEESGGTLHQYFLDIEALRAGEDNVRMIRVGILGNDDTEAGFYVSTPVDWNGIRLPVDRRPITMAINDSSWPGGPAQDQIEIYAFNLDFDTPDNTTVDQTSIITTPFDSYPCSVPTGFDFSCLPQLNGGGLDAIPEVIMNIPHLRNFGTHESLVFNFVTDYTDGDNKAGIRWVELRRTATTDWTLYQEGTFAPNDGLDRFMGSIAMDDRGNIGLAYNVTSADTYVGIRFTGRYANDPLGQMTVEEYNVIDGASAINSGGRFGDYSQLSVSPRGDNTFWFTTEYATDNDAGTRLVAFQLAKDTFDLSTRAILEPMNSDDLGAGEQVTAQFANSGLEPMANYSLSLLVSGQPVETVMIADTLTPDSLFSYQFSTPIDMSAVGFYGIGAIISHPNDRNPFNDTLEQIVFQLETLDGALLAEIDESNCQKSTPVSLTLGNEGFEVISTAEIGVLVNDAPVDTILFSGSLDFAASVDIAYTLEADFQEGDNAVEFRILLLNDRPDPVSRNNNVNATFNLQDPESFITFVFNTDEYPDESTWTLSYANSGQQVASGNFPFAAVNTTFEEVICLDSDSCYVLVVMDSASDGICCDFGEGSFSVLDNEGNVLISNGGNFGSQAVENFCLTKNCNLSAEIVVEDASGSNVADGSIMISAADGVGPYQYSIDGGQTLQNVPLFENLLPGAYDVFVVGTDTSCTYTETVEVSFVTGLQLVDGQLVEVELLPNPTQGLFRLVISNLPINDPLLTVEVFDLNGRLIQHRTIGKYNEKYTGTLSLYDYPDGHYFLRIRHAKGSLLERIVKTQ
ncbi:MAG: T9SS type A sorting domain-containing protein [Bacteroidota bacterium]